MSSSTNINLHNKLKFIFRQHGFLLYICVCVCVWLDMDEKISLYTLHTIFHNTNNIKCARERKVGNEENMYNVLIAYRKKVTTPPTPPPLTPAAATLKHQMFVTKNASTFYQYVYVLCGVVVDGL